MFIRAVIKSNSFGPQKQNKRQDKLTAKMKRLICLKETGAMSTCSTAKLDAMDCMYVCMKRQTALSIYRLLHTDKSNLVI